MLKHTSLIVAGALVLGMGISTASFAEMPSLDSQSYTWPGSTINTSSDTDKIAPDPKTGKRPGILDWEGMGADVSRHPDKPGSQELRHLPVALSGGKCRPPGKFPASPRS